jgi:hypothetical protein
MAAKSGLCAALGINVFNYGHRAAMDQMRTSWEKIVQFVGTNYGQDISNELQSKIPVILSEPVHTLEVLTRHAIKMVRTREENLQRAHLSKRVILEAAATLGADPDAPMQLAILNIEIAEQSVHSIASRQNGAGYQLEYGKHIIQPSGIVSADRENDSCADGGSIPVYHCV